MALARIATTEAYWKGTKMNSPLEQSAALTAVPKISRAAAIDNLIQKVMAESFGFHGSAEWVDAPYEIHDRDSDGRVTGAGRWRALRRFAQDAHRILSA